MSYLTRVVTLLTAARGRLSTFSRNQASRAMQGKGSTSPKKAQPTKPKKQAETTIFDMTAKKENREDKFVQNPENVDLCSG